jgi:hypothetical protein
MSQTIEKTASDRLLDSVAACLTPDAARSLALLRAEPGLQARVDELAGKCTDGQLSPEEREEYETYVRVSGFIAILQAKARKLLPEANSS